MGRRQERDFTSRDVNRLSAFSDAIFAIALTLPVLELRLPSDTQSVESQLPELWPSLVAYLVTFFVGTRQWSAHYRLFDSATTIDGGAINRNMLYLFVFSLLPFTTSTVMVHGSEALAVVIYALNLSLLGFVLAMLDTWLLGRGFIEPEAVREVKKSRNRSLAVGAFFVLQAVVGIIVPFWALFVPVALPLAFRVLEVLEPKE